jgi:hypothetical protein
MPNHALTIHYSGHYSGMTVEAQRRIASGVREILEAHLNGQSLPEHYVLLTGTDERPCACRMREPADLLVWPHSQFSVHVRPAADVLIAARLRAHHLVCTGRWCGQLSIG